MWVCGAGQQQHLHTQRTQPIDISQHHREKGQHTGARVLQNGSEVTITGETKEVKGPVSNHEGVVRCGVGLLVHEWRVCCLLLAALTPHPEQAAQHHHTQLTTALALHTQREKEEGISRPISQGERRVLCSYVWEGRGRAADTPRQQLQHNTYTHTHTDTSTSLRHAFFTLHPSSRDLSLAVPAFSCRCKALCVYVLILPVRVVSATPPRPSVPRGYWPAVQSLPLHSCQQVRRHTCGTADAAPDTSPHTTTHHPEPSQHTQHTDREKKSSIHTGEAVL